MQPSEQGKFIDLVTAAMGGNATGSQIAQWWRILQAERFDEIRDSLDTFARTSAQRPTPHNILELIRSRRPAGRLTPQDISRRYPIDLNYGSAAALARRMIELNGVESTARDFEKIYPTHGEKFVRELAAKPV